jgi:hypothetical protein
MEKTIEVISTLFPLKGSITQKILDNSDVIDTGNCVGYNTLHEAFGEIEFEKGAMSWGNTSGSIRLDDGSLHLTTEDKTQFMNVEEPTEVVFVISHLTKNRF